jgi:predicted nucleotidyltransferase
MWGFGEGVFSEKEIKIYNVQQKHYFYLMSKNNQIIQRIINVANKTAPDSEVYLYGSRAKGKAKRISDWDLLILLNSANISFDFETKFMDEFYEIELETGEIISPLIYSKQQWLEDYSFTPLFKNIKNEGIRLK